jgi:hypothetical protein
MCFRHLAGSSDFVCIEPDKRFDLPARCWQHIENMNVIHAVKELKPGSRKVCLAIGFFDGVHLGHQQIIRQTIADAHQHDAIVLVITFDRHQNVVVAPDHVPPLIYSLPQKLGVIESLGADTLLLIHFDERFSGQTGENFIRRLARDAGKIQSLCVGADFVFGHKRSGNVALLKKLGGELGFTVHGLAAVSLDNQIVSSTRIREAIRSGNLDAASQMLGRPYAISGRAMAWVVNSVFRPRTSTRLAWFCHPMVSMSRTSTVGQASRLSQINLPLKRNKKMETGATPVLRPRTAPRSTLVFVRRLCPLCPNSASRRTCSISAAIFTARNWKLKSVTGCAMKKSFRRSTNSRRKFPAMWLKLGGGSDFVAAEVTRL